MFTNMNNSWPSGGRHSSRHDRRPREHGRPVLQCDGQELHSATKGPATRHGLGGREHSAWSRSRSARLHALPEGVLQLRGNHQQQVITQSVLTLSCHRRRQSHGKTWKSSFLSRCCSSCRSSTGESASLIYSFGRMTSCGWLHPRCCLSSSGDFETSMMRSRCLAFV